MGLYRHQQQMMLTREGSTATRSGPPLRVRPRDGDAPDRGIGFRIWALVDARQGDPTETRLLIETSPNGEGWYLLASLQPQDVPHLVIPPTIMTFVRARLIGGQAEARTWVLLLANSPFTLDGPSTEVGAPKPLPNPKDPTLPATPKPNPGPSTPPTAPTPTPVPPALPKPPVTPPKV